MAEEAPRGKVQTNAFMSDKPRLVARGSIGAFQTRQHLQGTWQELITFRSGTMEKVEFVELLLFAAILLAAIVVPLAIAQIFEYFAFLPCGEIDEPLLLVLLRELGEARFERAPAIGAQLLAGNFKMDLDPRQTRTQRLLQAAPGIP